MKNQALIKKIVVTFANQDTQLNTWEEAYCPYCNGRDDDGESYNGEFRHDDDCLIIQARKVVKANGWEEPSEK